jgi:uncharacterized protein (TIGR02266 family)
MAQPRIRTRISAEFQAGRLEGKGRVQNMSEGGLFLGTTALPAQGETVRVTLSMPGRAPIEVTGMVWWTTADQGRRLDPGFGLRLLDDHEDYARMLASLQ